VEYRKGDLIYGRNQPSASIYLVIEGTVKVSRLTDDGQEVVVDIYRADEFFGEAAFLRLGHTSEEARAFEKTRLMAWLASDIESLATRQPRLAVALVQVLVQRNLGLTQRIVSFSVDDISKRVARTLLRLSERLGFRGNDGVIRMPPLTHELLSQYVGTSREVITLHMNRFRKLGYLRYSRRGMVVHRDALQEWLARNSSLSSESFEAAEAGRGNSPVTLGNGTNWLRDRG
jgi:CRP/FNR family transcriptional regulator